MPRKSSDRCNHPMIGYESANAAVQGVENCLRQFRDAKGRIGHATNHRTGAAYVLVSLLRRRQASKMTWGATISQLNNKTKLKSPSSRLSCPDWATALPAA